VGLLVFLLEKRVFFGTSLSGIVWLTAILFCTFQASALFIHYLCRGKFKLSSNAGSEGNDGGGDCRMIGAKCKRRCIQPATSAAVMMMNDDEHPKPQTPNPKPQTTLILSVLSVLYYSMIVVHDTIYYHLLYYHVSFVVV